MEPLYEVTVDGDATVVSGTALFEEWRENAPQGMADALDLSIGEWISLNARTHLCSTSDKGIKLLSAHLDPAAVAVHSLRSGFVTTAERRRIHRKLTMQKTLHETEKMITVYSQGIGQYGDNATADIGL